MYYRRGVHLSISSLPVNMFVTSSYRAYKSNSDNQGFIYVSIMRTLKHALVELVYKFAKLDIAT